MTGRKRLAVLLLCLAARVTAERRVDPPPAPRGAALLREVALRMHNDARAAVGVPPLAWSEVLAASARRYADALARGDHLGHAAQPMDRTRQGENLWMGMRDSATYDEMIGLWVAEQRRFVNAPTPGFSRTGRWQDVGHYTQIVWRRTTAVGCAIASDEDIDYLVCRYAPAGNVMGQKAY